MDVDTGSDDAMAIALAARLPNVCIEAITVGAGNRNVSTAYDNTLKVLGVLNRTDVPVYKGAEEPIRNHWNCKNGFCSGGSPNELRTPASVEMVELVKKGLQTLIVLAPLTNAATALLMEPDFLNNAEHVYLMGGNLYGVGNSLPAAEFNFFTDPEAAKVFLERATCPVTIVPWEACRRGTVPWDTYCGVASKTGPLQEFLRNVTASSYQHCPSGQDGSEGVVVSDFVTLLAAVAPESVAGTLVHRVDVELAGNYTRGQLVHAWEPQMLPHVRRNVTIVERFDVSIVAKYFKDAFDPPQRGA
ncbi:nucleoside hydrolase-like [Dermacentor andersoni]|uniref:nucleoside hydrolase-like n=1 Tax=Dermacentor andersoni TaxID=34620 RepID=UPI0021552A61|nr:nucleoside hydrolase-like [Dermacentor andersoni]